jgi:hypothetical protein
MAFLNLQIRLGLNKQPKYRKMVTDKLFQGMFNEPTDIRTAVKNPRKNPS